MAPTKEVGSDTVIQTQKEERREVTTTTTQTEGWEVVAKRKRKFPRVKTQRAREESEVQRAVEEEDPVPLAGGVPSREVYLHVLCGSPRVVEVQAGTRRRSSS